MDDHSGPRVIWWQWIGWLITLLALFFVVRWLLKIDQSVWRSLVHLRWQWLLAALLVFQLWFLSRFAAWEAIVRRHGSEAQRHQTLKTWTLSELARYVPGNLWSFAAKYRGSVSGGAKPVGAIQALAIEAFSQMAGAALMAIVFFAPRQLWWAALLIVVLFPLVIQLALRLLSKWKRWEEAPHVSLVESLVLLAWYSVVWIIFGFASAMIYWSFPGVPIVSLSWLIGINVAAWFIGYISVITPMGLGVRELTFVKLSVSILSNAVASLVALITRLWFVLSELLFLSLVLSWSAIQQHKQQ